MRTAILFMLLVMLLLLVFALQLALGSVSIPFEEVWKVITGSEVVNVTHQTIIWQSRLPGAIAAVMAGAGLSVSGLLMQTMFRNPVAGPYVLGISSGASLGVALLILATSALGLQQAHLLSNGSMIAAAALGAAGVFAINFLISLKINDVVAILIIGLMIGSSISALIEILQSLSSSEAIRNYVFWNFGSFRYVQLWQALLLTCIVVAGTLAALLLSKPLNALLLGDTYAASLGVQTRQTKLWIVLCTSVLAGSVTAFCGPVGFVGLAVPHIARALFKTASHLVLIPACALCGGIICALCNVISATPGSDNVLPVNAITSLLGAPLVIWIIVQQKRFTS